MRYIRSVYFISWRTAVKRKSANIVEILLEINYTLPWCLCRKRLWGHKNKNAVDRQYQSQDLVYVTSILYPDSTSFPREESTSNNLQWLRNISSTQYTRTTLVFQTQSTYQWKTELECKHKYLLCTSQLRWEITLELRPQLVCAVC